MRSLLSGGIKAILAVAVIATSVHWMLRLQREAEAGAPAVVAALPDVETTGSIAPRETPAEARPAAMPPVEARQSPGAAIAARAPAGLDQSALASLMATASAAPKAKMPAAKVPAVTRPVAAKAPAIQKTPAASKAAAPKAVPVAKVAAAQEPERPKAPERARTAER